jgi:hypothetical protein
VRFACTSLPCVRELNSRTLFSFDVQTSLIRIARADSVLTNNSAPYLIGVYEPAFKDGSTYQGPDLVLQMHRCVFSRNHLQAVSTYFDDYDVVGLNASEWCVSGLACALLRTLANRLSLVWLCSSLFEWQAVWTLDLQRHTVRHCVFRGDCGWPTHALHYLSQTCVSLGRLSARRVIRLGLL